MFGLVLAMTLAANPGSGIRVAAPALSYSNLDPRTGDFFLDSLGQQLIKQGIKVTSQKEIAAVLGLERQKQLLGGCGDGDACLIELAGAFGADAILTGSLAKTSSGFAINLKVVHSANAETLIAETTRVKSDDALLDWFDGAAVRIAKSLTNSFGSDAGVEPVPEPLPIAKEDKPAPSSRDAGAPKKKGQAGFEVLWNGSWYAAEVIERREDGKAFIHYTGYGDVWDEWVAPARLRETKAKEPEPPPPPPPSNVIEVEWNGTWYRALVLETKKNGDAYIKYEGYSDSWNEWVPPSRQRPVKKK